MTVASAGAGVGITTPLPAGRGSTGRRVGRRELVFGLLFLLPALILLGALVVYPIVSTVIRSLYDRTGSDFVGFDNYRTMFERDATRKAIGNNIVWVVVAPVLVTAVGLVIAVLTERVRFGTAFKIVIFMPLAISFLAAGVIFRAVYERDPNLGLANAILTGITDIFETPGSYVGARPSLPNDFTPAGGGFTANTPVAAGQTSLLPVVGLRVGSLPGTPADAVAPAAVPDGIAGVAFLDVAGGGQKGQVDQGERGLPGLHVEAVDADGHVAARATTDSAGAFHLAVDPGQYRIRMPSSNFDAAWTGWFWLGTTDVTPIGPAVVTLSVILAYLWIWTGFAMMVIAAGLSSIPRETQEAARVDGASEWQVFRRVTVPLLWPVLLVVIVTLVINVMKIFDLVLVIPPGSSQAEANVIAVELWRVSFGGARDEGLGSALAVLLFVLVLPFMAINIRRFRLEEDR